MLLGKVSKAVALVKVGNDNDVHNISDSIIKVLQDKHSKPLKLTRLKQRTKTILNESRLPFLKRLVK